MSSPLRAKKHFDLMARTVPTDPVKKSQECGRKLADRR
jgi:hypothetical protein